MNVTKNINAIEALNALAREIVRNIERCVIYLHGDLGVGKTTFVQLLLKNLSYTGPVTSPSYGIINQYDTNTVSVLHADLYRLLEPNELLYLDVDEWMEMADFICIEWPEQGGDMLPKADLELFFSLHSSQRKLEIKVNNKNLSPIFAG